MDLKGDATLILEGTNYVNSFHHDFLAINVQEGHTLTIKGTGALTAEGGEHGAGIGGGENSSCGDITIKDTVTKVTATRSNSTQYSIGAGKVGSCGTVTIGDNVGAIEDSPYTYQPDKQ